MPILQANWPLLASFSTVLSLLLPMSYWKQLLCNIVLAWLILTSKFMYYLCFNRCNALNQNIFSTLTIEFWVRVVFTFRQCKKFVIVNMIRDNWATGIAPWFRLHPPYWVPGFESRVHHVHFLKTIRDTLHDIELVQCLLSYMRSLLVLILFKFHF